MGKLVILPALISDIRKIYSVYFSAFTQSPEDAILVNALFPAGVTSDEFRQVHATETLKWWHTCDFQYTVKCVDVETNEIVGMGLADFYLKERTDSERKFEGIPWLEGKEKVRAEEILRPLHEMKESLLAGTKYIYVHVFAMDPKHQKRGGGALLVQWAIDAGEQAGLPVYFESSPSSVGLYEKMGFARLNQSITHKAELMGTDHDIVVPLMVKMPSVAKGMSLAEWREKGYPAW